MKWVHKFFIEKWFFCIVAVLLCSIKIYLSDIGFFWDSISIISIPAHYLYENGIHNLIFPTEVNVTTLATIPQLYTASVWLLFGRSLQVTHFAYLLILLVFAYQLYALCRRYITAKFLPYVYLFLLLDVVVFTQVLTLSADLFLLTFGVWSLNNLIAQKRWQLAVSLLLLSATSDRGMLLAVALMLYGVAISWYKKDTLKTIIKNYWIIFLPSILLVVTTVILQRIVADYWIVNVQETSPWGEHWRFVDVKHFFRNIAVTLLLYLANGNWAVLAVFFSILIRFRKKIVFDNSLLSLWGLFLLIICICTLPFYNPGGSRYYAFSFIILKLIISDCLIKNLSSKSVKSYLVVMIIIVLSTNLVVYPEKIERSWDGTLAHLPYFGLREQVVDCFSENNIDYQEVGVDFPMYHYFKNTNLSSDELHFSAIDFEKNKYVVYSNIFNLNDSIIETIKQYPCIKKFHKNGVYMNIYQIR